MLEKIKLSELDLSRCIYMSAGAHANETIEQIIERKQREVDNCGWSLWAFSSPIAEKAYQFCVEHSVKYVVMPLSGVNTQGMPKRASLYCEYSVDKKNNSIPECITATYTAKTATALVVEKYFLVDESDNLFNKGNYKRINYFNGVEVLELENNNEKIIGNYKKIYLVAKLKAPYIVKIE